MKKYLFSLIFILSITANSQADWREEIVIFIEENQELVERVFSEVKKAPLTLFAKVKDLSPALDTRSKKTTFSFFAALTAAVSGILVVSTK